jgi:glutaryl-CoA dehydrogenase (non-decarboxylating)
LPRLASGEALAAFALSEPQAGSDVQGVSTTLAPLEDGLRVTGVKQWISFGQVADVFLVIGKHAGKLVAVLVERSTPGLAVEPIRDMLGFRAAMLARITLHDCVVPRHNLVGSVDFGLAQIVGSVLDHGRYCIAFGSLGLAQASLDASRRYAQERTQFGRPLAEHQLIQQLLADMIVNVHAARLLCAQASRARAARAADMIMSAVVAKYFAARVAEQAASTAVQIHGANGCSSQYPVQRYLRDSKILQIIEGSVQMQQVLIAQQAGAVERPQQMNQANE